MRTHLPVPSALAPGTGPGAPSTGYLAPGTGHRSLGTAPQATLAKAKVTHSSKDFATRAQHIPGNESRAANICLILVTHTLGTWRSSEYVQCWRGQIHAGDARPK